MQRGAIQRGCYSECCKGVLLVTNDCRRYYAKLHAVDGLGVNGLFIFSA